MFSLEILFLQGCYVCRSLWRVSEIFKLEIFKEWLKRRRIGVDSLRECIFDIAEREWLWNWRIRFTKESKLGILYLGEVKIKWNEIIIVNDVLRNILMILQGILEVKMVINVADTINGARIVEVSMLEVSRIRDHF